uniref:Helitron helicase-like domain-containing protein n=1 Tax=Nelumbo nucifera TaxID=4432 RepID=A0A822XBS3_NELNU|nr:TPA_asm: hypothetical protein HUJ06_020317 [Nelumbo nucifera]
MNDRSIILLAKNLLHQFVVDMYTKLESTRLDYYRQKQSNIHVKLYQGIMDSVLAGETNGCSIGKRIVLPASFIGDPRDMRRRYLDSMELVSQFGKSDFFITMTYNPERKEIQDELIVGKLLQDRPNLTTRVFRAKLQDLKDQFFKKQIFGKVATHVHVIEFQMRGLSHEHLLIIMKSGYNVTNPD